MKKRILAMLMAIVMLLTIAGCGNAAAESYKTMAQGFIDDGNIEAAKKALEDGIAETKNKDLQAMLDGLSNADLSDYDGTWAEEDLSYENGGMILRVATNEGSTMLSFEYAEADTGNQICAINHNVLKCEIADSIIAIKKEKDIYENLVDMTVTISDDAITCEITNIEEAGGVSPILKEGTYTLVRNEEAYTILAETPWSDAMGVKADGFTEEPYYDTSKASGILAQLGMTEEEFRASCKKLFSENIQIGTPKGDESYYSDLIKYPNNYMNNHFVIDNLSGYDFECGYKGISNEGYTYYEERDYYNYNAVIYDYRDDVHSPNLTSGEHFRPYVIFKGLRTISGDEWLVFWMISVDSSEEIYAQEKAAREAKEAAREAENAEKAKQRQIEEEKIAKQREEEERKKKEEAKEMEKKRLEELQESIDKLEEMNK